MSIQKIDCPSYASLVERCLMAAGAAITQSGDVDVITKTPEQADAFKLACAGSVSCGARVQALDHWLEGQWELWGDGSKLVDSKQRNLILQPVLAKLAGLSPSASYAKSFASFVQDALAVGGQVPDEDLRSALQEYLDYLGELGLTEPASVQEQIAHNNLGRTLVFVDSDLSHPAMAMLLERLALKARVLVVRQELPIMCDSSTGAGGHQALREKLFSGEGGLVPDGTFKAMEVHGTHGESSSILKLVKDALASGALPSQVAVVVPSLAQEWLTSVQVLADADIPVSIAYQVPLLQTPFGAALLQLQALLGPCDDGMKNTAAFVSTAYSGLAPWDARGFVTHWRGLAGSNQEDRLRDLTAGLKGRVAARVWDEKLGHIRALMEASAIKDQVVLMYENAKLAKPGAESLADDAAAADAVLDYLELCEQLGLEVTHEGLTGVNVPFARQFGSEGAVRFCTPSQLPLMEDVTHVVFARLDMKSYPMAVSPAPFDGFLAAMGHPVEDTSAQRMRICLLNALEKATGSFACYRLTTTAEGDENCQSALWDELMAVFRSDADKGASAQQLSLALVEAGCGIRLSEAAVFEQTSRPSLGAMEVHRGYVDDSAFDLLMPDTETFGETFSPTAIEDYYRCPYRWLVCRRIGANMVDKEFDQIAKGNLAHAVLERFYIYLQEEGIKRVTPENLALCKEIANRAFDYQRQHEIDRHRLNLNGERAWQESEEVRKQVLDLVDRDAQFLPGFAPTFLELKLEYEDGTPLEYGGVKVRGKVDRIDMDDQGRAVVIDYKLSGLGSGYGLADEELPDRIQTDIYALLVQRCLRERGIDIEVVGSVYRSYAKNALRGVYKSDINWGSTEKVWLGKDAVPGGVHLESYEEYLAKVEATVSVLMEQMRHGDVEPRPRCKDACEYCLASEFCPAHQEGRR